MEKCCESETKPSTSSCHGSTQCSMDYPYGHGCGCGITNPCYCCCCCFMVASTTHSVIQHLVPVDHFANVVCIALVERGQVLVNII
ncbi:hypothetical protein ADUPG1_014156 [Aduncisulcus paluster]|uniref:Uncharacterized protein n=1 Tax=Aduncisulcus paluster TaxID=2918883 RepID=A0ABQ5KAZ8_9EUKA|nr:hypothetical protein ADUPG1_014156 [Aduncisulcus paluster]